MRIPSHPEETSEGTESHPWPGALSEAVQHQSVGRNFYTFWRMILAAFKTDGCYRIEFPATANVEAIRDSIRACADVKYATLNWYGILCDIPNDPLWGDQWGLSKIRMPQAWDIVTPSVMDTGLDIAHPDLVDNVWSNPGEIPSEGLENDGKSGTGVFMHTSGVFRTLGSFVDFGAESAILQKGNEPLPCGNHGNPAQECACTGLQIQKYIGKISGPLLDRIDIHVDVPAVKYTELSAKRPGEPSQSIRHRAITARRCQTMRFEERGLYSNADMETKEIKEFCGIDESGAELLKMAMTRLGLSARAYDRILKVWRTIADLAGSESIRSEHLGEAIQVSKFRQEFVGLRSNL